MGSTPPGSGDALEVFFSYAREDEGLRDELARHQLVLYGFAVEKDGTYRWTIPLVRETLLGDAGRGDRLRRLVAELGDDPSSWAG